MNDIDSRFMVLSAVDRGTPLAGILSAVDMPPRSVRAVLNSLAADGSLRVSSNLYTITDKGIETRLALQHLREREQERLARELANKNAGLAEKEKRENKDAVFQTLLAAFSVLASGLIAVLIAKLL